MGLHPSDIILGYTKAYRKTLELIESPDLVIARVEGKDIEDKTKLTRAILAPMASKQYGYEQFLAPLVAEACLAVMPKNNFNFQVDNVRVVKILGGTLFESHVIHGMVRERTTAASAYMRTSRVVCNVMVHVADCVFVLVFRLSVKSSAHSR
jgi:T-complex protein 1 subunit theta